MFVYSVTLRQALNEKGIEIQGEEQQGNKILLRFTDTETQLRASEVVFVVNEVINLRQLILL